MYSFVDFINALYHSHMFFYVTAKLKDGFEEHTRTYDSHLVAALGINWAHAVTIRLVLESKSGTLRICKVAVTSKNVSFMWFGFHVFEGQRIIKVAKSPMSPPLAFPFHITSEGISLLSDDGAELKGRGINNIHARGIILCAE